MMDDLNDILNDEALFENFETDKDLFSTKRYQGTVRAKSRFSSRKRVQTGFDTYRNLFTQVHADIASGKRQIKSIEETSQGNRISQKNPINKEIFMLIMASCFTLPRYMMLLQANRLTNRPIVKIRFMSFMKMEQRTMFGY